MLNPKLCAEAAALESVLEMHAILSRHLSDDRTIARALIERMKSNEELRLELHELAGALERRLVRQPRRRRVAA
jgi:hypothetical protein